MHPARREASRCVAGRSGALPAAACGPPDHLRSPRRGARKRESGMPNPLRPGCPGPPNRSRRVALALAALGSATLLGLGFSAAAAEEELAGYRVENHAIPESLTGRPGNPVRGERIVRDPDKATCLICHAIPIEGEPDPGNIGPPLHGVASRYTAGELRLRLVEPKRLNPETVMPSYYEARGLYRVATEYRGRSIYSASEIEDVIAYLLTLSSE